MYEIKTYMLCMRLKHVQIRLKKIDSIFSQPILSILSYFTLIHDFIQHIFNGISSIYETFSYTVQ